MTQGPQPAAPAAAAQPAADPGRTERPAAALRPLVIAAPFGNYIQPDRATATLGTYTAAARPGRLWRFVRTVRYYPRLRAWVNRIGLRNPGIDHFAERVRAGRIDPADKILSIHGFEARDWQKLLDTAAALDRRPLAVELNMSCPNVGEVDWPADLFSRAVAAGLPVIAKLPPINYHLIFDRAMEAGVRAFHCCNTLPIPAGGLSGKPLMPLSLQCIRDIRSLAGRAADDLTLIGGGGVTRPGDIDQYAHAGADHVAVGTKTMNPLCLVTDKPLRPLIDHADRVLAAPDSG